MVKNKSKINPYRSILSNNSSKGSYYALFKQQLKMESYLSLSSNISIWLTRIRTANHRLPVETGRWYNIPRNNRKCNFCNNAIGDEYHFMLECQGLSYLRKQYLPTCYCKYPSIDKFISLLSCTYKPLLVRVSMYIKRGLCMLH